MTDDLDHDLTTLLAQRASTVTPDATAGEQAIAARLRAGDHALADVVPLAGRSHRGRWLAVAAAAVLVVVAGVLVLREDDRQVETGPAATAPSDTTEWVVRASFLDATDAETACAALPGVGETYTEGAAETASDGGTSTPTETLFVRVIDRTRADAVATCLSEHDGTEVAVDPYVAPTPPPNADDPLVAVEGESAKDLAERVAQQVFGDEYVTMQVEDAPSPPSAPGTKLVTMEGSSGDSLVAYVAISQDGVYHLATLTGPGLDGHLTTESTDGVLTGIQLVGLDLPPDQVLHVVVTGLSTDLEEVGRSEADLVEQRADLDGQWSPDAAYLAFEIQGGDGTPLRALQPATFEG